jgi:hypothetical protein
LLAVVPLKAKAPVLRVPFNWPFGAWICSIRPAPGIRSFVGSTAVLLAIGRQPFHKPRFGFFWLHVGCIGPDRQIVHPEDAGLGQKALQDAGRLTAFGIVVRPDNNPSIAQRHEVGVPHSLRAARPSDAGVGG